MNTTKLNFSRLNTSCLNSTRLNTVGFGGGKGSGGGVTPPEEDTYILNDAVLLTSGKPILLADGTPLVLSRTYVLQDAVLLSNGKPLLLTDGTPLVMVPKSETPELDASLVDAWIFSGYKNEDAPEAIAGVKGTELTCYNFAWNEEGSGFKDGALWFDGVDDYLHSSDTLILNDFTLIIKRNIIGDTGSSIITKEGTFSFETMWNAHRSGSCTSFGNDTAGIVPSLNVTEIKYMTPTSYNGEIRLTKGESESGPNLIVNSSWGNPTNKGRFSGYIDYFALYSRALTESEIQSEIEKLESMWNKQLNN